MTTIQLSPLREYRRHLSRQETKSAVREAVVGFFVMHFLIHSALPASWYAEYFPTRVAAILVLTSLFLVMDVAWISWWERYFGRALPEARLVVRSRPWLPPRY